MPRPPDPDFCSPAGPAQRPINPLAAHALASSAPNACAQPSPTELELRTQIGGGSWRSGWREIVRHGETPIGWRRPRGRRWPCSLGVICWSAFERFSGLGFWSRVSPSAQPSRLFVQRHRCCMSRYCPCGSGLCCRNTQPLARQHTCRLHQMPRFAQALVRYCVTALAIGTPYRRAFSASPMPPVLNVNGTLIFT